MLSQRITTLCLVFFLLLPAALFAASVDLDTAFGTNGSVVTPIGIISEARAIVQHLDGIIVAGYTNDGIDNQFILVRYDLNGNLDTAFGVNGIVITPIGTTAGAQGQALLQQSDGKLVVAGSSDNGGISEFALIRYEATGDLDPGFGTEGIVTTKIGDGDSLAYSIVQQDDGKLVVAGSSIGTSTNSDFALVRYNADGSLDADPITGFGTGGIVTTDFGYSGDDQARVLIVSPYSGTIYVGGAANIDGFNNFAIASYSSDGTLNSNFGSAGLFTHKFQADSNDIIYDMSPQTISYLRVAGKSNGNMVIATLNVLGDLTTGWGIGGTAIGGTTTTDDVSMILPVGGTYLLAGFDTTNTVFERFTDAGLKDTSFGTNGRVTGTSQSVSDGIQLSNGQLVTAGQLGNDLALARYNTGINGSIRVNDGYAIVSDENIPVDVPLELNCVNDGNGCTQMRFSDDGVIWQSWQPYATSTAYTLSAGVGYKFFRGQFSDGTTDSRIILASAERRDIAPKIAAIFLNSTTSASGFIQVSWFGSRLSGATYKLQVSTDGTNWNDVAAYSGTKTYYNYQAPANGNYQFRVANYAEFYNLGPWTTSNSCAVTLTVADSRAIFLSNVGAAGDIQISWFRSGTPGVDYVLERSTDAGVSWNEVYRGTNNFFNDLLGHQTYIYRVSAEKTGYNPSGFTQSPSLVVTQNSATPDWITVSDGNITGDFNVSWDASSIPGAEYLLQYSTDNGITWQDEDQYTVITDTSVAINRTAGTYRYRVQATKAGYNPTDWVVSSGSVSISLEIELPGAPIVPANNTTGDITLTWTRSTTTGVTYVLEESTDDGLTWISPAAYEGPDNMVTLSGRSDEIYKYRVKATLASYPDSAFVAGANSCEVILTTVAPNNISVPAPDGTGYSWIYWPASATPDATYELEYGTGGDNWIAAVPEYIDNTQTRVRVDIATISATEFRVRALSTGIAASPWTTSNTHPATMITAAPRHIYVPAVNESGSYQISWFNSATSGASYMLDESADSGVTWTSVYSGSNTYFNIVDQPLDNTYIYRVTAWRAGYVVSAATTSDPCVVTLIVPALNGIFMSDINQAGVIQISWFNSSLSATTYEVEISTDGGTTWAVDPLYTDNSRNYVNSDVSVDSSYQYRVRALKLGYQPSDWILTENIDVVGGVIQ